MHKGRHRCRASVPTMAVLQVGYVLLPAKWSFSFISSYPIEKTDTKPIEASRVIENSAKTPTKEEPTQDQATTSEAR